MFLYAVHESLRRSIFDMVDLISDKYFDEKLACFI